LPNREKLKTFIRAYAIRLGNRVDSPWIFYDSSIKDKYHIHDRLPASDIDKFQKSMTITLDVCEQFSFIMITIDVCVN
jgi:hypothetical protein